MDEESRSRLVRESLNVVCDSILESYDPSEVLYVDEKTGEALVKIWDRKIHLELACHVQDQ